MKRQKNASQHSDTQQAAPPPEFPLLHNRELLALVASFLTKRTRDLQAWACACKATLETLVDPVVICAEAVLRGQWRGCHPVSHLLHAARFATDRKPHGAALGMLLRDAVEGRVAPLSADDYVTSVDYCSKAEWWEGLGRLVAAGPHCVAADQQAAVMSTIPWQKMLNEAAENDHVGILLIMGDHCTAGVATEALALASSMQFAQALLAKGADLADACARGALNHVLNKAPEEVELVELLLRGGADANAAPFDVTPLDLAVDHAVKQVIAGSCDLRETVCPRLLQMLMQHGADPGQCGAIYNLMRIPYASNDDRTFTECFMLLLSRYGDVSRVPRGQRHTLLAYAALRGRADVVDVLLKRGADPVPALVSVVTKETSVRREAIRLLLDLPQVLARVKRSGDAALRQILHAVMETMYRSMNTDYGEASLVRYIVQKLPGVINSTDAAGRTPLMVAVNQDRWHLVQELLALGADPFAVCRRGSTALHMSVQYGYPMCAAVLLAAVGDPKRRKQLVNSRVDGLPPLLMVMKRSGGMRNTTLVEQLLRAGADPNAKTPEGHTALHLALHGGVAANVQSLLDFGANTRIACPDHPGRDVTHCACGSALRAMVTRK